MAPSWQSDRAGFHFSQADRTVMKDVSSSQRVAGVVLVGTHQWTQSAFDLLMTRALLPVAHRPLLSYSLSWLAAAGIPQIAVCGNRNTRELPSFLRRQAPTG